MPDLSRPQNHVELAAGRIEAGLLRVVDGGLAACLLVVPLLLGGRHAIGQLALVLLSVAVAAAWGLYQAFRPRAQWRPTWAAFVLLAATALVALQGAPLPQSALRWLAPHTSTLLPLWQSDRASSLGLGAWRRISLTPGASRAGLALLVSYTLLFLVTVQRVRDVGDIERLLRCCAISAIVVATLGLAQGLAGNGRFLWVYQAPYATTADSVKGSFTNRNHFAHFLALGIGPLLWWLHGEFRQRPSSRHGRFGLSHGSWSRRESRGYLLAVAAGMVLFAGLLSLSRGGSSALFLAATISGAVCCRAASVRGRFVGGLAAAGLLIAAALAIFGYDRVSDRLSDLTAGSIDALDKTEGRRRIWRTNLRAMPDFARLGAGVGSHAEVYPMYLEDPIEGREYTHAENGYLQVPLETGAVGGSLLALGIGFCLFWCVHGLRAAKSTRLLACQGAVAAGLAASLLHSAVDFVWYVPGCMAMVAVLAGCACRGWRLATADAARPGSTWTLPPLVAPAVVVLLVVAGSVMAKDRLDAAFAQLHWDRYLVDLPGPSDASSSKPQTPAADQTTEEATEEAVRRERRRIEQLERVVAWQPGHARAQLALAQSHLHLFDLLQQTAVNPMSLPNLRDAAIRSQSRFPSRQARDAWLSRAIGAHRGHLDLALRHTREALVACPLQGRGYLYLAELVFLDGEGEATKRACIEQALRVRPYDGYVLYAAANEAWLAGEPARWLAQAKEAFRCSRSFRKRLFDDLVANTAPEGLETMIDFLVQEFQPDLAGLGLLEAACRKRGRPEQLVRLRQYHAQTAEFRARSLEGPEAAATWLVARRVYTELGDRVAALQCARNAYQCDPDGLAVRSELARTLLPMGLFPEARAHLQWCLQRKPGDENLKQLYRQAVAGHLDAEAATASPGSRGYR